ncbi:MAG TPA: PadR family transcriptional regulator [Vicinamibacterales bacterium]|nr:PadR family transcriptional regulator [Vicinamibacterales bacterium]
MRRRPPGQAAGDLLAGTLDMLILRILRAGPAHGLSIAQAIERRSDAVLFVEQGSLYPALHRLEARGWVASYWGASDTNRRARFYRVTPKGRRQLVAESSRWQALARAVARVMVTE